MNVRITSAHHSPRLRARVVMIALLAFAGLLIAAGIDVARAQSTQAGRPATITATILSGSGGSVSAKVNDTAGATVTNGTPVRFTLSKSAGPSTTCLTTTDGTALQQLPPVATGTVIVVTTDWNEAGAPATCASVGAYQLHTSVTVGGSIGPAGPGTFAAPPVYSAGNPRLAQVVFNSGSVAQLEVAMTAAVAGGAWVQPPMGGFCSTSPARRSSPTRRS